MEYIKLGNAPLSYNDCYEILINNKFIELDYDAMAEVYKSHSFLKEFIKDKVIYGVNTGFGPMAQYKMLWVMFKRQVMYHNAGGHLGTQ